METYYHINGNYDCDWEIGDEIVIGQEDNPFWRSFIKQGESIHVGGKSYDIHSIVRHALSAYRGVQPPPREMNGYHFNPLQTLQETFDSLGNSIKACRELSFEYIRVKHYPEIPSRQRCVWLVPNSNDSLAFWKHLLHGDHQRIFKVAVEGKTHRAAQKWLTGGTFPLEQWYERAHCYWKGQDVGGIEDEILFEGKMKLIARV